MLNHKTSVHFVNTEGNGNKILVVPTYVLLYWKKFILVISSILLVLLTILGIFIYQRTSQLYQEELIRANYIKTQIDIKKLKESFKSIDESMFRVNEFMKQRGLKTFKLENVGGVEGFEIQDVNEVSTFYEDYINDLEKTIESVPMGKPHQGKITSHFGTRKNPFNGYGAETHSGIDFKGKKGEPIRSTANGKVVSAGPNGGYGNCVVIKHDYNLKTLYGHLSKINVKVGDQINIGDTIGRLGSTGRSTGPHLHYEIHFKGKRINPIEYLSLK